MFSLGALVTPRAPCAAPERLPGRLFMTSTRFGDRFGSLFATKTNKREIQNNNSSTKRSKKYYARTANENSFHAFLRKKHDSHCSQQKHDVHYSENSMVDYVFSLTFLLQSDVMSFYVVLLSMKIVRFITVYYVF